jgi:hypothetical protein
MAEMLYCWGSVISSLLEKMAIIGQWRSQDLNVGYSLGGPPLSGCLRLP